MRAAWIVKKSFAACLIALLSTALASCGKSSSDPSDRKDASRLPPMKTRITKLVTGAKHACALLSSGVVKCWGDYLFEDPIADSPGIGNATPTDIAELHDVIDIAANRGVTYALSRDGRVYRWSDKKDDTAPRLVDAVKGEGLVGVVGSIKSTCGLQKDGTALCQSEDPNLSAAVSGGAKLLDLVFGYTFWGCYLSSERKVHCFGNNGYGASFHTDDSIVGLPDDVVALSAGADHACARSQQGELLFWGGNSSTPKTARTVAGIQGKVLSIASRPSGDVSVALVEGGSIVQISTQGHDELSIFLNTAKFPEATESIAAGDAFVCGIVAGTKVVCQGLSTDAPVEVLSVD